MYFDNYLYNKEMEIPDTRNVHKKREESIQGVAEFFTIQSQELSFEEDNFKPQLKYQSNFKQLLTAFLPKKTLNSSWQIRYFTLTPTRLIYYTSDDKQELKGCFNLISLQSHQLTILQEYPVLTFIVYPKNEKQIRQPKELLKLNIQHENTFQDWCLAINQIISTKDNLNMKLYPQISQNQVQSMQRKNYSGLNFWNKIVLSSEQLQSYANHMDIMFFRSKSSVATIQRFFMGSYFDHVGLLFKNQLGQVFLLQAIQSRGVWVNEWREMQARVRQTYEQIGYRKIVFPSSFTLNEEKLQSYLNSVLGKRYQLSLSKLISDEEDSQEQKDKTYFCSELIADIYIKFGLIKGKKNDFWPKDFQRNLKLQEGAALSPLMQIQF